MSDNQEEQKSGRPPFDPRKYVRVLRGKGGGNDYLDVSWRLVWLRSVDPSAILETESVLLSDTEAIFKTTIILSTGGSSTGFGSETKGDFPDFREKAETKSRGRALHGLGFDIDFADPEGSFGGDLQENRGAARPASPPPQEQRSQPQQQERRSHPAAEGPPPQGKPTELPQANTGAKINMEAVRQWEGKAAYWRNAVDSAKEAQNADDMLMKVNDRMQEKPDQFSKMGQDYLDAIRAEMGFAPIERGKV